MMQPDGTRRNHPRPVTVPSGLMTPTGSAVIVTVTRYYRASDTRFKFDSHTLAGLAGRPGDSIYWLFQPAFESMI